MKFRDVFLLFLKGKEIVKPGWEISIKDTARAFIITMKKSGNVKDFNYLDDDWETA